MTEPEHDFGDRVIPFYGGGDRRMFAIERRAMDRDGRVVEFLDGALPRARVLDVGAGDGHTAELLSRGGRTVVAMEPDGRMIDRARDLTWIRGVAQKIPLHDGSFAGAYATWAFFLSGTPDADIEAGVREMERVVASGGPLIIVDNAGGDEFTALADHPIAGDGARWERLGFESHVIDSSFRFDSLDEARALIGFYFGDATAAGLDSTEIGFRVVAHLGRSSRPGTEG